MLFALILLSKQRFFGKVNETIHYSMQKNIVQSTKLRCNDGVKPVLANNDFSVLYVEKVRSEAGRI
ncbi:MAG: hypothetical protein WC702_04950 [Patescibacteria group bacterium]|jgi:hypothetical protein